MEHKYQTIIIAGWKSKLLDTGCCFGTDIRYCINSGCDPKQVLGVVNISNDFIELGFNYFKDKTATENRFKIKENN